MSNKNKMSKSEMIKELEKILEKINNMIGPEVEFGTPAVIELKCGCQIATIKGLPRYTGFLKFCDKHKEEIRKIDPELEELIKVKVLDMSLGS